jgi:hypothetical protein
VIPLKRYKDDGRGPGDRELWNKIEAARRLVAADDWQAVSATELNEDFDALGDAFDIDAYSENGKKQILTTALTEIKAENYFVDGAKTSIALATAGMKLWTFRWQSENKCFGKSVMYMKFCIRGTGEQGPVYIHCIHVDNPPPDKEGSSEE